MANRWPTSLSDSTSPITGIYFSTGKINFLSDTFEIMMYTESVSKYSRHQDAFFLSILLPLKAPIRLVQCPFTRLISRESKGYWSGGRFPNWKLKKNIMHFGGSVVYRITIHWHNTKIIVIQKYINIKRY